LSARHVNCLVLDEPTNHLDLPAIEQLESAVETFAGTVLLVTHDRALLDAIRLSRRIELAEGQIVGDEPVDRGAFGRVL
jgi:ATPase subunit of ABC transporter with duplicated ATPase domains